MVKKCAYFLMLPLLGLMLQSSGQPVCAKATTVHTSNKSSSAEQQEPAIRSILIALEKSFAAKDAASIVTLFAPDAVFIDQRGEEVRGRDALKARFDGLFKNAAPAVGIHSETITLPAGNVALIAGEVSRRQDQSDLPATRFSMVMVKTDGNWLINQITETALQAVPTESQLKQLEWMIGNWSTEKSDNFAELNVEWSAQGKKFITSKCILHKGGNAPQIDSQIIGWDPQHNSIVSWHFDSNGGFGTGVWTKQTTENTWNVDVTGVGADGSNTRATNSFSIKSPDEFVWQSTHRTLDGLGVPDGQPIAVHRVKLSGARQ